MDLTLDLDISKILDLGNDLKIFENELHRAAQLLAGQTHLHILESVQQKLHTRREIYIKNLAKPTEIQPGVFMITLGEDAGWIEDGMPPHSMVLDLLGDNPEVAKDGSRYRVIRFDHSKGGATQTSPAEQVLVSAIKTELKKMRIPWKGVERNGDGSPKSGVLHKIKMGTPDRPPDTQSPNLTRDPNLPPNQHGYGHGAVGSPMVGPTGIPFLKGLTVSQSPLFDSDGKPKLDKKGKQMAGRTISTFRVVSSKHEGKSWRYPGIEACSFFDEAVVWAEREWDQKMLPDLLKKLGTES
jgi:hypothetical protein